MNFRSSTSGWKDSGQNLQTSSYEYGYGGGRTDLPAVGYNPVYPSFTSSDYNCWGYTPTPIANAAKPQQENNNYVYQGTVHHYQQEYNPEYPGYHTRQQPDSHRYRQQEPVVDQRPITLVRVNQSAFSVTNTLKTRANPYVVPIPREVAATNTNRSSAGGNSSQRKKKKKNNNKKAVEPAPAATAVAFSPAPKPVPELSTPRPAEGDKSTETAVEPIEVTSYIKEAPMSTPRRGGGSGFPKRTAERGGVQKRYFNANASVSSFSMNPWNGGWNGGYGGMEPHWGGFRGGSRGGWRGGRAAPRPQNKQDDIPFEVMPDGTEMISLKMDPENISCFHGPSSVFTTQHQFPVLVEGKIYESVDHFYQYKKVKDLCGNVSDKLTEMIRDTRGRRLDGKCGFRTEKQPYSQIAREQLKLNHVDKKKVDEWRVTKGLAAVQEALVAKAAQSGHLREALAETDGKILVHAFSGDSIYGTGATIPVVKKWCLDMKNNGTSTFSIPATFPLTEETVKTVPVFSRGRNILGVILMQLREMLSNGNINIVDLTSVLEAIKKGDDPEDLLLEDLDIGGSDFSIGGGSVQAKMGL